MAIEPTTSSPPMKPPPDSLWPRKKMKTENNSMSGTSTRAVVCRMTDLIIAPLPHFYQKYLPRLACRATFPRSEEHTSELQSRGHLVCRLLLEKKNRINNDT